jgi:hypothetical protein
MGYTPSTWDMSLLFSLKERTIHKECQKHFKRLKNVRNKWAKEDIL